ncbi:nuclear transport factor 2 family protein [Burkholderia anthina]|uniref:nuclear transport factor 2 family protein n=1 Tax=Burkholderia anthina TaxID=179879 RepID=UPI00158B7096|nr:nuclear transport factor 2 family protein [Burkholderia anthina]
MTLSADTKLEVQEAVARAYQALDGHDARAWAESFTQDGTFEAIYGAFHGRGEIQAFIQSHIDKGAENGAMHTVTNFVVDGSNDAPAIHGYVVKFGMDRRPVEILGCAKLTGRMTRQAGRWMFEHLALAITLTAPSPAMPVK